MSSLRLKNEDLEKLEKGDLIKFIDPPAKLINNGWPNKQRSMNAYDGLEIVEVVHVQQFFGDDYFRIEVSVPGEGDCRGRSYHSDYFTLIKRDKEYFKTKLVI